MASELYDRKAPRKATNLSINAHLLAQARELGLNLSALLEERLSEVLREARRQQWREENRQAIQDYNERVAQRGSFGDAKRRF